MGKWPETEVELARPVVSWLEAQGWTVYQEVQPGFVGAPIADIVAVQGHLLWIVECKRSFGLSVLEQCEHWLPYANFVTAAYPYSPNKRTRGLSERVADWLGVGQLAVRCEDLTQYNLAPHFDYHVRPPRLNRKPVMKRYVADALTEQHRTFAEAGNAEGLRWTPYRQTCAEVLRYVQEHPGASAREVVSHIRHHYSSDATARSCLVQWGRQGKVYGVRVVQEGRHLRFYEAAGGATC